MEWTKQYRKALTFSYDDGNEQDVRLIEIFNRYGLKATFNLNTGLDQQSGAWKYKDAWVNRLTLSECVPLFDGHEIAVHGSRHLNLNDLTREEIRLEIREDAERITALFGKAPVGMAYAYGCYNPTALEEIAAAGLRYARTVMSSHQFGIQTNLLEFAPTCHHDDDMLFSLAKRFLEEKTEEPQIFYIWGHSYEFDGNHNWDRIERLCELLAGRDDIFYGTNAQVLL